MVYLKSETAQFEATKKDFAAAYEKVLEGMFKTFREKGAVRDIGSPIHHRMSPEDMRSIAAAKCRRVESLMSHSEWETRAEDLKRVIEECSDVANYATYISALCLMIMEELC